MNEKVLYGVAVVIAALAVVAGASIAVEARVNGVNTVGVATAAGALNGYAGTSVPMGKGHAFKVRTEAWKWGRALEVSAEYNETIVNILTTSTDTSSLLEKGFAIIAVRPIVKAYVQGDGSVTLKATQAIVLLSNGSEVAEVLVDITNNTVTILNTISKCYCPCATASNQISS